MKQPDHRKKSSALAALRLTLSAALAVQCSGCTGIGGGFGGEFDDVVDIAPLPSRNENVSLLGPGSEYVDLDRFSAVRFAFDSTSVSASEMPKVEAVARYLNGEGAGATVILGGFTDIIGSAEYNRQLGELRALRVRGELIGRTVDPGRIQTVSFGEDRPAVPGSSASAHASNRRVEFGIVRNQ